MLIGRVTRCTSLSISFAKLVQRRFEAIAPQKNLQNRAAIDDCTVGNWR
jgi:hypothetical protein